MTETERGPIAWMTRTRVTPNLLMVVFLVGGFLMSLRIKQEVFPEFQLDMVTVRVPYPGASPEEVEQGICLAIEEGIRGLDGVKEVTATAAEGAGTVVAELLEDADRQKVYQDIKQEVDRIVTFPLDAEEPEVMLNVMRREVLTIELFGDIDEWVMHEVAELARDRLLQHPGITQVDLKGVRRYEIVIEVSQDVLRGYGLSLQDVVQKVRTKAVEIPGGKIETRGGEVLLRVKERRDWARQFADMPIITTPRGATVSLGDIADVREDLEESDTFGTFNGKRAVGIGVYRIGAQTPVGVSDAVREAMAEIGPELPPGVDWKIRRDSSDIYRQRLGLLLRNAFLGLILVLATLGVFLEFKLAFWVTLGIPTSFLGALLFLPGLDVTINMISMFAFIVALGIVVDDAIVAGENIYEYRQRGMGAIEAAVRGARNVAVPVTFSILTNIVAFCPLFFVPGVIGKIWRTIPAVVSTVFLISLVEALFILPAHLAHTSSKPRSRFTRFMHERQQAFSGYVRRFIRSVYGPVLDACIRFRTVTVAAGIAVLVLCVAYVVSGRIGVILMPRVESDYAVATAVLPYGSPVARAMAVRDRMVEAAQRVIAEHGGDRLTEGIFALVRENEIELFVYLTDPEVRPIPTAEFAKLWRTAVGSVPGLESIKFESDRGGPGSGAALTVELSHRRIDVLDRAGSDLASRLEEFAVVRDIDDGYTPGKQQLDFKITPEGESLGLTAQYVAREVRNAFEGSKAIRQQRGRNEVTVRVRRPVSERVSEYDVERMIVRTPRGGETPLMDVARVERGHAYTVINRRNGRRTVTVTADVVPISETSRVMATLTDDILPQLAQDYRGLGYRFEGRQADFRESLESLYMGLALALLCIYVMLAVPFGSYWQPLIVMMAIPFGIVGAVLGHILMGYAISVLSLMGIVALAGVVVNDSLVLIDYANRLRRGRSHSPFRAIHEAGVRRFRPILLTTLTTFGGLAPMIFETSRQARFMIPMAISLGYGILFATAITLVIVPCLYMLAHDVGALARWLAGAVSAPARPAPYTRA